MRFSEALGIKCGDVVCVTGAGGKTSLIKKLAEELSERNKVLVSTTTRMAKDEAESMPCDTLFYIQGEKAMAPDMTVLAEAVKDYDFTLLEADGAARKRLKGWAVHEPVIPEFTTVSIGVLDIGMAGKKADEADIHRPELFTKLTDVQMGDEITLKALKKTVSSKGLFKNSENVRKVLYMSKAEGIIDKAQELADIPSAAGDITTGMVTKL